jgi:hypothetical protein
VKHSLDSILQPFTLKYQTLYDVKHFREIEDNLVNINFLDQITDYEQKIFIFQQNAKASMLNLAKQDIDYLSDLSGQISQKSISQDFTREILPGVAFNE